MPRMTRPNPTMRWTEELPESSIGWFFAADISTLGGLHAATGLSRAQLVECIGDYVPNAFADFLRQWRHSLIRGRT